MCIQNHRLISPFIIFVCLRYYNKLLVYDLLLLIYTLSNATVSVHWVKSPNMRNPESCDSTSMNSHLLREVVVSWVIFCQFAVSVNSILKDAMLFMIGLAGIG